MNGSCSDAGASEEDSLERDEKLLTVLVKGKSFEGVLNKWTNYIYGWQKRYVVLCNGTLSYSIDPNDVDSNYHGVMMLAKCSIKVHPRDELRFDITSGGFSYFFRADSADERQTWVNRILTERDLAIENSSLKRTYSFSSFSSVSSFTGLPPFGSSPVQFHDILKEIHDLKDTLFMQVDNLQHYYDIIGGNVNVAEVGANLEDDSELDFLREKNIVDPTHMAPGRIVKKSLGHRYTKSSTTMHSGADASIPKFELRHTQNLVNYLDKNKINLASEISDFRSTTVGLMSNLLNCIENLESSEKSWAGLLAKEREQNRKLLEKNKFLSSRLEHATAPNAMDVVEGPDCVVNEEEFFDAVDSIIQYNNELCPPTEPPVLDKASKNPYHDSMEEHLTEAIQFLSYPIGHDPGWILYLDEPNTKIFKKEIEVDNIVVDPHRVIHLFKGISAKEVAHYFWDLKYRLQVDNTVEQVFEKARFGEDVLVVHQLHKHIWPATRRDSCLLSCIRAYKNEKMSNSIRDLYYELWSPKADVRVVGDSWMVTNRSVDHPDVKSKNCIRVDAKVSFLAQSFVILDPSSDQSKQLQRSDYLTILNYSAVVNPGGWLPPSAVRALSKREFARFVVKLGDFVVSATRSSTIDL